MRRILACSFLLFLAVGSVPAQHHVLGTLAGNVLGADDAPAAGARVTIQQADGHHPHATLTDAQGHFEFPLLRPGPYDVRAYSKGVWTGWQHHVIVRANKTTTLTLHLPKREPK
jgi:hypothetical protein